MMGARGACEGDEVTAFDEQYGPWAVVTGAAMGVKAAEA